MQEPIIFPIRINRYLYLKKICSRREADRLIEQGQVLVNNKKAVLGQQVIETDNVGLKSEAKKAQAKKYYVAFNKPVGVVSHDPQQGEQAATDYITDIPAKLSPLGRLDKASHGLMILSNDGTIVDKLLNPKYDHEKEYLVKVDKRITPDFLHSMRQGVSIERYKTKPAQVEKIDTTSFIITLTEGKKHQIRRMAAALGYQVQDLQRIRIQTVLLDDLALGTYRILKQKELSRFLSSINH